MVSWSSHHMMLRSRYSQVSMGNQSLALTSPSDSSGDSMVRRSRLDLLFKHLKPQHCPHSRNPQCSSQAIQMFNLHLMYLYTWVTLITRLPTHSCSSYSRSDSSQHSMRESLWTHQPSRAKGMVLSSSWSRMREIELSVRCKGSYSRGNLSRLTRVSARTRPSSSNSSSRRWFSRLQRR
jgi:hypothetical protein